AARRAASKVVASLGKGDYLSLVTFNEDSDVEVSAREIRSQGIRDDFEEEIDDLEADGSTNIEEGMRDGFEQIAKNLGRVGYENRLILITDARPNTGRHGENDFLRLLERWSSKDVGMTAIGVGANFGVELATQISNVRGGNYRFVPDGKTLGELFEKDFDFLVTPLAYDMRMQLEAASGYRIKALHGVPGWEEGDSSAEAKIATLFLSRSKGAIAVEIEPFGPETTEVGKPLPLLKLRLAYSEVGGKRHDTTLFAELDKPAEGERAAFTHGSVAITTALAFSASAMREACRSYHEGRRDEAASHLRSVPEMVEEIAQKLNNNELMAHAKLVRDLQRLVDPHHRVNEPAWPQTKPEQGKGYLP
ncbi:MAG: VWA domain-containing protein, partial [Planctomycetes bacterium]|nr:VWA domain-containing protein [Planctomycetota bacterium]